jgi:hypothetical protein
VIPDAPWLTPARIKDLGVSQLELVTHLFQDPALYRSAEVLSEPDRLKGGRPRLYPNYFVEGFNGLKSIFGSARAAATAINEPFWWHHICQIVREQFPREPSMWLPAQPPSRTWWIKRRNREVPLQGPWPSLLDDRGRVLKETGVETARELGLLDPDGLGSANEPDLTRIIYHDGKAIAQLFNGAPGDTREVEIVDPDTGEIRTEEREVRADPDVKTHITGDNRQIHGSKFWHGEVRGNERFSRVFLAVDYVPSVKGEHNSEADIALKNIKELAILAPGAQASLCDTMFRGAHHHELQRSTGLISLSPVAAESVDKKTGTRTEKTTPVTTVEFVHDDGTTEVVEIWSEAGRLCQEVYLDDGTQVLDPLPRTGNPIRQNSDGTYRTYVEYLVTSPSGRATQTLREPTYNRPADDEAGFNRAENVRQIPPGDPYYEKIKGRRSDAEAANREIENSLYLNRAHSLGARRQLYDLYGYVLVRNALARGRHRRIQAATAQAA